MTTRLRFDDVPLAVAGDPSSPRALIIIQEAFGVNDHIREVAERFASRGYYAVAPELFHRVGSPEIDYENFPEAMTAMATLDEAGLRADVNAAAGHLAEAGFATQSVGVVGYCMGGTVAFYTATLGIVGAAASYYGGGITAGRFGFPPLIQLAPRLSCDWIGFYGDLDKGIPVDQVAALREEVSRSAFVTEVVRYADAEHGFHCDSRPAVFNASAAADAYGRTLAFFTEHLAAR